MMFLIAGTIGVSVVAFTLGWFHGYKKACRAHGWYLTRFGWKNDARRPNIS
jgi:hypothetical protein